ncbi:MAG: thioesterase family protein [Pseudomonadota bacterium]
MNRPISTTIELEIPFHDVDSMFVVWHGHYVKYIELARCALLDSFGYGYTAMRESGYAWPVVDMRLKYVKSARFEQRVRIHATLEESEYRIKIAYRITDVDSGETLTKGYTVQAAVDLATGEMCYQSPAIVAQRIAERLDSTE